MRNDGEQLGENNKENFRNSGMKRVRGQNEVEGEQQMEKLIAKNSQCQKKLS